MTVDTTFRVPFFSEVHGPGWEQDRSFGSPISWPERWVHPSGFWFITEAEDSGPICGVEGVEERGPVTCKLPPGHDGLHIGENVMSWFPSRIVQMGRGKPNERGSTEEGGSDG